MQQSDSCKNFLTCLVRRRDQVSYKQNGMVLHLLFVAQILRQETFSSANKSAFNVGSPKIAFNYEEVDTLYGTGGLGDTLKTALRYFSQLKIDGIVQGDILFTDKLRRGRLLMA